MKKRFLMMTAAVAVMGLVLFTGCNSESYVDLGLPSGTKWKNQNEKDLYTYEDAMSQFENSLPTKEQWKELDSLCQWEWNGSGYTVTGPNGSFITLPAEGYRDCYGHVGNNNGGYYWSSTLGAIENSSCSYLFTSRGGGCLMEYQGWCCGCSIRLVQK